MEQVKRTDMYTKTALNNEHTHKTECKMKTGSVMLHGGKLGFVLGVMLK